MTSVTLHESVQGYTLKVRGHATGSPAVCAAASCLVQTAAGWLRNTKDITIRHMEMESGKAVIKWRGGDRAKWLFGLLEIGFLQLSLTAPEYIKVKTDMIGGDSPDRATHGGDTPATTSKEESAK